MAKMNRSSSSSIRVGSGTVAFILITAFLNLAGVGLLNPVLPAIVSQYVPKHNVDAIVAALLISFSLCQFIAVPTLGALSDRYGRRVILLVSLLGSAAGYLIFGLGGALWVLFLGRIIDGLTGGNLAAIYAYAADITEPKDRTKFFGQLGAAAGFGFVIGPALGGLIYSVTGGSNSAPLYFAALVTLANTVWGYFAMPESLAPEKRSENIPLAGLNPFSQLLSVFKLAQLRVLLLGIFLWVFAFAIMQSNLSSLTETHLGWRPDATSVIFFVVGVIGIIVQGWIIPRTLPRYGELKLTIIGLVSLAIGFSLLALLAATLIPALVFAGIIFTATGNGLVTPTFTGLLSQSVGPRDQGRVQGGSQSIQALARVLAPVWVGVVLGINDQLLPVPYITGVIALLVAIWAVIAAIPILKAHQQSPESVGAEIPKVPVE